MANQFAITAALVNGLQQGIAQARREKQAAELQKLLLLSKSPGYELQPAAPGEVQPANWLGKLFGQEFRPSSTGAPVIGVGGTPFTIRQQAAMPPLQNSPLWQALIGEAEPAQPLPPTPSSTGAAAPGISAEGQPSITMPSMTVTPTLQDVYATDPEILRLGRLPATKDNEAALTKRMGDLRKERREADKEQAKALQEKDKEFRQAKADARKAARDLPLMMQPSALQAVQSAKTIEDLEGVQSLLVKPPPPKDYGDTREAITREITGGTKMFADLTDPKQIAEVNRRTLQETLAKSKAGATTVAVGSQGEQLEFGKIETGTMRQIQRDAQGRVIAVQDVPIPGSDAEREARKEQEKKALQAEYTERGGLRLVQLANRALNILETKKPVAPGELGIREIVGKTFPSTPEAQILALTTAMGGGLSITTINEMRQTSPTGAALGPVSEGEHKLMSEQYGSLNINQPPPILAQNLKQIVNTYLDMVYGTPAQIDAAFQAGKSKVRSLEELKPYKFRYALPFDKFGNPVEHQLNPKSMQKKDLQNPSLTLEQLKALEQQLQQGKP